MERRTGDVGELYAELRRCRNGNFRVFLKALESLWTEQESVPHS